MDTSANPFAGTSLHDMWYLKRRAPKGKVAHLLNPENFGALCAAPHCKWQWIYEDKPINVCTKCKAVAYQASLAQEKDNERLK